MILRHIWQITFFKASLNTMHILFQVEFGSIHIFLIFFNDKWS